ncbi:MULTISPECIES: DUF1223 domain-containing protein [unclassified Thalassospira]|uniref:DUF1223 domain-containing protein n=1 Tax=Thalassospira TaxID=168934 RepID=UPI00257BD8BF|nr:DUF1223 domain-containing protein [Thalassospira sp.]
MKHIRPIICMLALALMMLSGPAYAAESTTPHAVIELYTSQGCNSCPPADRVLYQINQEHTDLLALSYHVDYWNYLGWTDPFSDSRYSDRQRDYANRMRERYVYTPQVIINGDNVVQATAKRRIESTADSLPGLKDISAITLASDSTDLPTRGTVALRNLTMPGSGNAHRIWIIGFDREHQRDVLSGENAGKRLVHANVVREMIDLGPWDGSSKDIPFAMTKACDGGIAVLVQNGNGGPIISASVIRY